MPNLHSPTNAENPTSASERPDTIRHHIYISIISHDNELDIINGLKPHTWKNENKTITPIILLNKESPELKKYCEEHSIIHIENKKIFGFGANNNKIFAYLQRKNLIKENDYFLCINPDIIASTSEIIAITEIMKHKKFRLAAPNLVNQDGTPEDNIRKVPTLFDAILRLLLNSRRSNICKTNVNSPTPVDWASGAFLCFQANLYNELKGFDENYFMYYEDADICLRGSHLGAQTYYIPQVTVTHNAERKSRNLVSKALLWHIKSALRFAFFRNQKCGN